MCTSLFTDWMAHLCGLCLTLRAEHGQASRVVTNYDGLLISVLVEAQRADRSPHRKAGPCALRGMKTADVVSAKAEGARLAAAVSLLLAAGKTRDHIADGDGPFARRLVAATADRVASRWDAAGARTSSDLGFDAGVLREAVERQTALETTPGRTLLDLTEPTETAVAAAFAHTAVLAGRPENEEPLAEAGRFFGRLAHLLDAVEDLPEDRASGAYNPLLATGAGLAEARRQCDAAHQGLRLALDDLTLEKRPLVHALLVHETGKAIRRAFADPHDGTCSTHARRPEAGYPSQPGPYDPNQQPYGPGPGQQGPYGQPGPYGPAQPPYGQGGQGGYGPQQGQWGPPPGGYYDGGGGAGGPGGHGGGGYGGGGFGGGGYGGGPGPGKRPWAERPGFWLVCLGGLAAGCTCGLWQPPWSKRYGASCGQRCWCSRWDCDCGDCCDCCECCACLECCDC
jgi:hypothetical protein